MRTIEARLNSQISYGDPRRPMIQKRDMSLPYRRGGISVTGAWGLYEVEDAAFAELSADPWVELVDLDAMDPVHAAAARARNVEAIKRDISALEVKLIEANRFYQECGKAPEGSAKHRQGANARTTRDTLEFELEEQREKLAAAVKSSQAASAKLPETPRPTPGADAVKAATPSIEGLKTLMGGTLPVDPGGGKFMDAALREAGFPTYADAVAAATPSPEFMSTIAAKPEGATPPEKRPKVRAN